MRYQFLHHHNHSIRINDSWCYQCEKLCPRVEFQDLCTTNCGNETNLMRVNFYFPYLFTFASLPDIATHPASPRRSLTEAVSVNGPEFFTVSDYLVKFGLNKAFRSASRAPKSGLMIQDHGSGPRGKKPEARGGGGKKSRSRKKKVMGKKAPNFLTRVPSNGMVGSL